MDSRRSTSVAEVAKIREKHQSLLQDYLVLQKECVSRKRKLKEAKEKKETLLDEIRFLKHRRNLLLKMQSQAQNPPRKQDTVHIQKEHPTYEVGPSERYAGSSEVELQTSRLAVGSIWNSASLPEQGVGLPSVKLGKKPKDTYTNGKRAEKRKISWQDQLALKV